MSVQYPQRRMERTKNINKDSLKKDILWFCGKVIAESDVNIGRGRVGILVSEDVIKWLLEPENPSMKYRTLVELLGKSPNDHEAIECKSELAEAY